MAKKKKSLGFSPPIFQRDAGEWTGFPCMHIMHFQHEGEHVRLRICLDPYRWQAVREWYLEVLGSVESLSTPYGCVPEHAKWVSCRESEMSLRVCLNTRFPAAGAVWNGRGTFRRWSLVGGIYVAGSWAWKL